jgi:hypothetical protein
MLLREAHTKLHSIVGHPAYMCPEMLLVNSGGYDMGILTFGRLDA